MHAGDTTLVEGSNPRSDEAFQQLLLRFSAAAAQGTDAASLNLDGTETFDITGLESGEVTPRQDVKLTIHRANDKTDEVPLTLRIDTPIEIDYYLHGGILPYVLRQLLAGTTGF